MTMGRGGAARTRAARASVWASMGPPRALLPRCHGGETGRETAPERERRAADVPVKRAHEIREILEADLIGDLGDRAVGVAQERDGAAQSQADEILMGRHRQLALKHAQEMKGAQTNVGR